MGLPRMSNSPTTQPSRMVKTSPKRAEENGSSNKERGGQYAVLEKLKVKDFLILRFLNASSILI